MPKKTTASKTMNSTKATPESAPKILDSGLPLPQEIKDAATEEIARMRVGVDSEPTSDSPAIMRLPRDSDPFDDDPIDPDERFDIDDLLDEEDPEQVPTLQDAAEAGMVSVDAIRGFLTAQGFILNKAIGKYDEQWFWNADEIDYVAPAMARMARRSALLRRAAQASDAVVVASGAVAYVIRNLTEAAIAQQETPDETIRAGETPQAVPTAAAPRNGPADAVVPTL